MNEPMRLQTQDGRSLDLYLEGPSDGTALVFHCGTPSSGLPFGPFVDALAERGMQYVSWSRPGYGSSTRLPGRDVAHVVEDTTTVLDHLGAERCYVLGWSGGGPHALASAALLPERVEAVATIGSVAPWPAEGLDWMAGMGEENVEEFSASLEGPDALIAFKERAWPIFSKITAAEVADAFGDLIDDVDRGSLTGEFAEWMAAVLREGLREGYWGWFDDDMAFIQPWGFDLATIRVPVHLWQGAHDRMVPFAHGEWLAAHVGSACPHLFPEHGHLSLAVDAIPAILDELIGRPG
ncbi:MAG TPA: alpha/beta hydrolase [Candidatus Dormibacteraeota bacterium]|nr:alpha/beta hydrolase [Candidatus Dormibacteraeota bacterium]